MSPAAAVAVAAYRAAMTAALPSPVAPPSTDSTAVVPVDTTHHDVAGELVASAIADPPELAALPAREQILAAAWLASLRAARTRRGYATDWPAWHTWLTDRGTDVLAAAWVHVDLWVRQQQAAGDAVTASTATHNRPRWTPARVSKRLTEPSSVGRHEPRLV